MERRNNGVTYIKPRLTIYGNIKQITRTAPTSPHGNFLNGSSIGNHIDKPGTPGTPEHGGINHQIKHHGLTESLILGDPGY